MENAEIKYRNLHGFHVNVRVILHQRMLHFDCNCCPIFQLCLVYLCQ